MHVHVCMYVGACVIKSEALIIRTVLRKFLAKRMLGRRCIMGRAVR